MLSRWNRRKSSRRASEKLLLGVLLQQVLSADIPTTTSTTTHSIVLATSSSSRSSGPPSFDLTTSPRSQSYDSDHTPGAGYLKSVASNPSPAASFTSSPMQSTLSSVYSDSVQGSPLHRKCICMFRHHPDHPTFCSLDNR